MQTEAISLNQLAPIQHKAPASLIWQAILHIVLGVTTLAVFVPISPTMPSSGIDASYSYAMNEAIARHMRIGHDILFTYGPYAAICTRSYDPATDSRMIWGSLFLGTCYLVALLFLAPGKKIYLVLFLLLFLATFGNGEVLLLSYPLLLVLCVMKESLLDEPHVAMPASWPKVVAVLVMWTVLGVVPLTKGSLVLPFAVTVAASSGILAVRGRMWQAVVLFLTPVISSLVFWLVGDQSLRDIPEFLHGTSLLTSGYTEAMATSWSVIPASAGGGLVLIFVAISALILFAISRSNRIPTVSGYLLGLTLFAFLLVAFKHGFVASSNLAVAFTALAAYLVLFILFSPHRYLGWCLVLTVTITTATSVIRDHELIKEVHDKFGVGTAWTGPQRRAEMLKFCMQRALPAYARSTYKRTWATYSGAWNGINLRLFHPSELNRKYSEALLDIRKEYPLAVLSGAGDIYAYDQSVLLASENKWNPRPVLQSYSAYTPELARLDEQHLRGDNSPDWIAFDLQTIGNRLPSLDDGMSWPAIFDNYSFLSADEHFVLLRRKQSTFPQSSFAEVSKQTCGIGKTIALPQVDGPLFAEIDLKPTLAGKIATTLLNPPQLSITIVLKDGTAKKFRVISEMMKTGFLISPFIADTSGFASLMRDHQAVEDAGRVQSISITPAYGGSLYWSGNYQMALRKYVAR